ncbi:MAG: 50S ribosomal protein L25 [bacterium]|nr:50S ribosomal protein L25 [bacterium]
MQAEKLDVELRTGLKKNAVKKIRKEGLVPAVIYGGEGDNKVITINPGDLQKIYKMEYGRNTLIEMNINDGKNTTKETVITYKFTIDPVKMDIKHVDFLRIDNKKEIEIDVRIRIKGSAPGIKLGGIFLQKKREIRISTLPENIPAFIDIDVSSMAVGDVIRIKDLVLDDKIKIVSYPEIELIAIEAPRKKKDVAEGAEESGTGEEAAKADE